MCVVEGIYYTYFHTYISGLEKSHIYHVQHHVPTKCVQENRPYSNKEQEDIAGRKIFFFLKCTKFTSMNANIILTNRVLGRTKIFQWNVFFLSKHKGPFSIDYSLL